MHEDGGEEAPTRAGQKADGHRAQRPGAGGHPRLCPVDPSGLAYESEVWHLGVVAAGEGAEETLRLIAEDLGRDLLLDVRAGAGIGSWGGGRAFDQEEMDEVAAAASRGSLTVAVGEPGRGSVGRRTSRHQARTAFALAVSSSTSFLRYRDVAVLATVAADRDLVEFLVSSLLVPICALEHREQELPATLRAFLDAGCDIASTAATLRVSRQSVVCRIRLVEELIGQPLHACLAELDLALRLGQLR